MAQVIGLDEDLPRPSIARNSFARLISSASVLGFGFIISILTARLLGPADKGTLSALSFLGDILFFHLCTLGLGEASIVLIGQDKVRLQRALSSSLLPMVFMGSLGLAGLFVTSLFTEWNRVSDAVLLQGAILVVTLYMNLFQHLLHATERFGTTTVATASRFGTTALLTWVVLTTTELGLAGAVAAALVGVTVSTAIEISALKRIGLSMRPVWDRGFLATAARLGVAIQASSLLVAMSQRADQVIVYSILGEGDGGRYAVALTLGFLPGFIPMALAHASFPRLTHIRDEEVWLLTARTARVGLIVGFAIAIALALAIPLGTTYVFGSQYAGSVAPALVLLPSGLFWSLHLILARARAARGRPGLLLWSFAVSTAVMLVLDVILIPVWGSVGAALASLAGSVAGLVSCLVSYRRDDSPYRGKDLVPRPSDIRLLAAYPRSLMSTAFTTRRRSND